LGIGPHSSLSLEKRTKVTKAPQGGYRHRRQRARLGAAYLQS